MQLPDSVRRGLRTFAQAFLALMVAQAGLLMADLDDGEIDFELWKRVVITAAMSAFIGMFTWIYNALEDRGSIPSVLKSKASSGADPITQDPAV